MTFVREFLFCATATFLLTTTSAAPIPTCSLESTSTCVVVSTERPVEVSKHEKSATGRNHLGPTSMVRSTTSAHDSTLWDRSRKKEKDELHRDVRERTVDLETWFFGGGTGVMDEVAQTRKYSGGVVVMKRNIDDEDPKNSDPEPSPRQKTSEFPSEGKSSRVRKQPGRRPKYQGTPEEKKAQTLAARRATTAARAARFAAGNPTEADIAFRERQRQWSANASAKARAKLKEELRSTDPEVRRAAEVKNAKKRAANREAVRKTKQKKKAERGGSVDSRGKAKRPEHEGTTEAKRAQGRERQRARTAARRARFEAGQPTEADLAFREHRRQVAAKDRAKLKEELSSDDPEVRKAAEIKLSKKKAAAAKSKSKLTEELHSSDPKVREAAEARREKQRAIAREGMRKLREKKMAKTESDVDLPPPTENKENQDSSWTREESDSNKVQPDERNLVQTTFTRLGKILSAVQTNQFRSSSSNTPNPSPAVMGLDLLRQLQAAPFLP